MPKTDLYQCDNEQCPDESETRDIKNSGWIILVRPDGDPAYFCKGKCLRNFVEAVYR